MTSEVIECKICCLQYDEQVQEQTPRMLTNCGHTICEKCAEQLLNEKVNGEIECPFDRQVTSVQNINSLPRNFAIIELIQALNESTDSSKDEEEEEGDEADTPCAENLRHEAEVYCDTCASDFCEKCFDAVHSYQVLSSHVKISMEEKTLKLPKCPRHEQDDAEYICTDTSCVMEDKIMCEACLNTIHQFHEHNDLMVTVLTNKETLEDLIEPLDSLEECLKISLKIGQECFLSFDAESLDYQQKIREIEELFDVKKAEAVEQFKSFAHSKKTQLEKDVDNFHTNALLVEMKKTRVDEPVGTTISPCPDDEADKPWTEDPRHEAEVYCAQIRKTLNASQLTPPFPRIERQEY
ncbi:unnamed protein product [Caenorhabditis sp. 36 PRJEB53466]|nr:unnamed protein product [Caenorhabditis sp. 36 PRJEB53466]